MIPVPYPNRAVSTILRAGQGAAKRIRRHPLAMETHFRHSLVITWAFAPEALEQFCVPGLELDTYTAPDGQTYAFAAVALVDLEQLRVAGLPRRLGTAQLMAGYRVFMRMRTGTHQRMRGLRILASQSTAPLGVLGANLTTRYHYTGVQAELTETYGVLHARFTSREGTADLEATAYLGDPTLPAETPFATERAARRFAGPLPYTFSPDPDGIVVVKSSRTDWTPQPVRVEVAAATFFDQGPFAGVPRRLANAFHVADLDYGWQAGELHRT